LAKKQKYYVVWNGHEPGIYDSWKACQAQIKNYPGAEFKSFVSKQAAEQAYSGNYSDVVSIKKGQTYVDISGIEEIIENSIAVDAACSGNPGDMEYRGVHTFSHEEIFRLGPFKEGTNNVGEFLALVHALALFNKEENEKTAIYSDSRTAMAWVRKKKSNTKLKKSPANQVLFKLIKRAEDWLQNNTFNNPILKWETKLWGEIPADFGRK